MPDYGELIEKYANKSGISASWLKKIMRIESGGDTRNITGSYKGLFQLSDKEFKAHGGTGDILDPEQNTAAASNMLAKHALAYKQKYGKDPKLIDLYLIHQQGAAGSAALRDNPDQPAWKSIAKYYSSEAMAKKAIWGNLPADAKVRFGSVENVTGENFINTWSGRVEGTSEDTSGVMAMAPGPKLGRGQGDEAEPQQQKKAT